MILKNDEVNGEWSMVNKPITIAGFRRLLVVCLLPITLLFSGCYTFKDVSIPREVKTFRVNYIENKARYINPQLAPQLTDKLRQKIMGQTRLAGVQAMMRTTIFTEQLPPTT